MKQRRPHKQSPSKGNPKPHGNKAPNKAFSKAPSHTQSRSGGQSREGRARSALASSRLSGLVIYGVHAVKAALENPERRILRLLATQSVADSFTQEIDFLPMEFEIIEAQSFSNMMPEGAVHQGIAAVVEPLPDLDIRDLIDALAEDEPAVFVMLDQVSDPHNVGAIIRSCAAFGAKGLIMQDKGAPQLSGVLAKTASGAADVLPVAHAVNLSRAIELLQENGFFVVGLDERGQNIATLPRYERLVLVMGAEGAGLRRLVAEHCDLLASLPTQGKILSLNVSNAAAVALYATLHK